MSDFKVGDMVRVVTELDALRLSVGDVGVVESFDPDDAHLPWFVDFNGAQYWMPNDWITSATVYKLQVPAEPAGVTRVRPVVDHSLVYERQGVKWRDAHGLLNSWWVIVYRHPDGLEPVPKDSESEYDAAVSWFRERPEAVGDLTARAGAHAAVIIRRAMELEEGLFGE